MDVFVNGQVFLMATDSPARWQTPVTLARRCGCSVRRTRCGAGKKPWPDGQVHDRDFMYVNVSRILDQCQVSHVHWSLDNLPGNNYNGYHNLSCSTLDGTQDAAATARLLHAKRNKAIGRLL